MNCNQQNEVIEGENTDNKRGINEPAANAVVKVLAMPFSTMGKLCRVSGTASVPAGAQLLLVRILVKRPTDPRPTDQELFYSGQQVYSNSSSGDWVYPVQLDVACSEGPADPPLNNRLYVSSFVYVNNSTIPVLVSLEEVTFRGLRSDTCD